jgi:membrane associated rhomboid family serine protease
MLRAPKWTEFPKYPVIAGTALLATAVSIAFWAGADVSPLFETAMIRRGELWRLVTSMFPHLSVLHLVFNIYWLWVFGAVIESTYGHLKTAALLLLFAVGSGCFEFAFSVGGAGLSGVGYGFFGLLWVLSRRDERFRDVIDSRTILTFVVWFFLCIAATVTNVMPIGNFAHGAGAILGILTGFAITLPKSRVAVSAAICAMLAFGLWGATLGRPMVNFSGRAGYEEGKWGYDALIAHHYPEAVRWFRDATRYQPKTAAYRYDLGIAYQGLGNTAAAAAAYRQAADLGDPQAEFHLGSMYESGNEGVPKDISQALYWYRKAADRGDAMTQNNVAWIYATSTETALRNPEAALKYAHLAVDSQKDHPEPYQLDTLAEAYYVNQQYSDAVTTEQRAIALALTNQNGAPPQGGYQASLEKYQSALKLSQRRAKAK